MGGPLAQGFPWLPRELEADLRYMLCETEKEEAEEEGRKEQRKQNHKQQQTWSLGCGPSPWTCC